MDIQFSKFRLDNNLRVIVHQDAATPMAAVNVLYDVGARDEHPEHTGFAHLFEHLMFGGSIHIPSYDEPLQRAGGDNNAYTTNDFTNYFLQIPKANLETAFWLESDRMLSLAFSPKSLMVQKKVVMEEFKENYLNKPYGDAWKYVRELSYKKHPYRWMTIGKNLEQIEQVTLEEVKTFFKKHYNPSNAILCVAGNVSVDEVKALAEQYFGNIPAGEKYHRHLPKEPKQLEARQEEVSGKVPVDALYKTWHIGDRLSESYYKADIITEILSNGRSAQLYQNLIKEKQIFSQINCYHTGSLDPGMIVISGHTADGVSLETANEAVDEEIEKIIKNDISDRILEKAVNKIESNIVFEDIGLLARANNLAYYELLGNAELMNEEMEKYRSIHKQKIKEYLPKVFRKENSNTLFYRAES